FGTCVQLQPKLKRYGDQQIACFAVDQDENQPVGAAEGIV
ncbi:MAG: dipeptide ABC transporter ATP binding subunit DppF, partial [Pantoea sp.]|nr:dipeptide ABC transporter ATP binding subunit DppF [Pantoea sp.]